MLRFRLFGIPYEITPYFWLGSAIMGGALAQQGDNGLLLLAVWVLCVLVSIVAHELGHALAARYYGLQPSVALYQFGGLTFLPGGTLTRGQHIVVSLAGPAAGGLMFFLVVPALRYLLVLFGADHLLYDGSLAGLMLRATIVFLLEINGFWTLFNLLPIQPLDGGQVLRDVLGPRWFGVTRLIGAVCAGGCCVWFASRGNVFTAIFLGYLAYANFIGNTRSLPGGVGR